MTYQTNEISNIISISSLGQVSTDQLVSLYQQGYKIPTQIEFKSLGIINITIIDSTFVLNPGEYYFVRFSVPSDASISGNFTSSTNADVLVLDEHSFIEWSKNYSIPSGIIPYYNSGLITAGSININVPQGTYYLVYSNTFSIITSKTIVTKVDVSYTPIPSSISISTSTLIIGGIALLFAGYYLYKNYKSSAKLVQTKLTH